MAAIQRNYDVGVKRGRLTAEVVAERLAKISPQLDYRGFETADVVIEAVFENMELKKEIFRELAVHTRPECILASNTSTLNIDEFASVTSRPQNVVGLHFFSPANVMRLLEIVRGRATTIASDCHGVGVGQAFVKSRSGGGELPRFRGQSHDVSLHV
jgi:3-hydroxyacyl-CoA dehydrogenase